MNDFLKKHKKNLTLCTVPMFIFPLVFLISSDEFIVAILITMLAYATLLINYKRNEWKVFVAGILLGIIVEIGGDLVFKAQYWDHGSFFGIPVWLPVAWGYGFIHIRRIGNALVHDQNKDKSKSKTKEHSKKTKSNNNKSKK